MLDESDIFDVVLDILPRHKGWASLIISVVLIGGVLVWWTW